MEPSHRPNEGGRVARAGVARRRRARRGGRCRGAAPFYLGTGSRGGVTGFRWLSPVESPDNWSHEHAANEGSDDTAVVQDPTKAARHAIANRHDSEWDQDGQCERDRDQGDKDGDWPIRLPPAGHHGHRGNPGFGPLRRAAPRQPLPNTVPHTMPVPMGRGGAVRMCSADLLSSTSACPEALPM